MTRIEIDVGGTWTRVRRGAAGPTVLPTPSRLRHPDRSGPELVDDLLALLDTAVPQGAEAVVSFGAALDEARGVALGSGPLWGADVHDVPVLALLRERRADVAWRVANDVTCALADFARQHARPTDRWVAYLTISSGIALRMLHLPSREVPVDGFGLQGEVGHLTAVSSAPSAVRELPCPCGGRGHVSSLSAGPALPLVAEALGLRDPAAALAGLALPAAERGAEAGLLLSTVVEPVAELLRTLRVLHPHVDLVGLGGGVVEGLTAGYGEELRAQLVVRRSYADRGDLPRLYLCAPGEVDPGRGAGLVADGLLHITP